MRTGSARWLTHASNFDHSQLQDANLKLWAEHNTVDQLFGKLRDVYEFAEPLLRTALKDQYGVEDDVRTTFLHLYLPKQLPWYATDPSRGVVTRTVSLLDAALHNFADSETCEADSDFISQPDERGLFDLKPIKRKMSSGLYTGQWTYTVGPGMDFDMGDIMQPSSSMLTLNFTLDVQHTLKIDVPPGGNRVELVPQGGWQSWLTQGRKAVAQKSKASAVAMGVIGNMSEIL